MRIVCTHHARQRLAERFGVDWSAELEIDIGEQLLASDGPIATSDAIEGAHKEDASYWRVRIGGQSAVLVITPSGAIITVLPNLKLSYRPKAQKRRGQKKLSREKGPRKPSRAANRLRRELQG